MPVGALQHLHHRQVAVHLQHQAVPHARPASSGPGRTRPSRRPCDAAHHQQRPAQLASTSRVLDGAAAGRPLIAAPPARRACASAPGARRPRRRRGRPPRAPAAAGRSRPPRRVGAATPPVDQRRGSGRRRRAPRRPARRPSRRCRGVVGAERALLQHPLAQQPAAEQHHPLVARAARPRRRGRRARRAGRPRRAAPSTRAAAGGPLRVAVAGVPGAERVGVPGERARPAHRRVVPGVGQVAVQRPQAAHEPLGVRGDRLGHVAAGRGDRADDR